MVRRAAPLAVSALLAAGTLVGFAAAAAAPAVGPGTWTKITTPAGTTTFKLSNAHHHFSVSGETSNDVTSVDVVCVTNTATGPIVGSPLASAVPVAGGTFSAIANITNVMVQCRLRAIPTGVDPTSDYLGSYTGPILYTSGILFDKAGSTIYGFRAIGEQGDGFAAMLDAAQCGPALSGTVDPPAMDLRGVGTEACAFALPGANLASTASSITVNGHNAYLPFAIHNLSLAVTQPALTVAFTRLSHGNVRVSESAPLMRCSTDTYPPTNVSCPSLVNTGVTFRRISDIFRGAHQIRLRDSFTSTDGQGHSITMQYEGTVGDQGTGAVGYTFPGGSTKFHRANLNQVVTGLGSKAGTMYARSDVFAASDDPLADTLGLTWSRAPHKVQFSGTQSDFFAMPYALSVPAHGRLDLGFAYSKLITTSATKKLAGLAVGEMVNPPAISSPGAGAVIQGHRTTVKGSVALGANGLPTSVKVNGHAAHLTKVSATKATYKVSFNESFGKHTITVTAKDVARNTKSKSIKVKNVAP
jgi:hypothetical protein